jgi:quercetin 2,3-dioxygenase
MTVRGVKLVRRSRETLEGAGVHLRRAFGNGDETLFDPFLMLDDFRNDDPAHYRLGFPWHPHRGIETITYVLEGEVDHGDSLGNQGTIGAGDVQWMTAGSGIIHQEMPRGDQRGRMGGFQLWVNLPARHKMTDPRYQGLEAADIPTAQQGGATIRVVAGRAADDGAGPVDGPVTDLFVQPTYLDVTLAPGAAWKQATASDFTAFAYVFAGAVSFGETDAADVVDLGRIVVDTDWIVADPGRIVLFEAGDHIVATAGPEGARFLFASGRPLHEPIAWRGPIVMNHAGELDVAWRELEQGTFIKHSPGGIS